MNISWFDKKYNRKDLPNDVESLKDIIDGLVSTVQLLQQQNILLQQEVMDLRYQNEEIRKEIVLLREDNRQLKQENAQLRKENLQLKKENAQLREEVEGLKGEIKLLKQEKFGKKSEKTGKHLHRPRIKEGLKKKHPGRQALPPHLERVRVEHDLSEEEKRCPLCEGLMEKIQEITTEQLDLVPAILQVKQHVRFQYACKKCYGSIRRAEMPAQPIDKGLPTSRLIAQVMMSKFADHMPFYRQESWFTRQGCPITRSTLWGWEAKAAFELLPLVNCLKEEIQGRDHIFGDDTPMPTIEAGRGETKTGRFWAYTSPKDQEKAELTVYEYTEDRKGKHPQTFLENSRGFLQADAYAGFKKLFKATPSSSKQEDGNMRPAACWAHVRRKFVEVLKIDPNSVAQEALEMIDELYKIERLAREGAYTVEMRETLRKKHSKPLLKKFHKWLIHHQKRAAPKSRLGGAIQYALNQWAALNTFLLDGRLEVDNNRAERAIKPVVIGRKNYLFMAGPKGGEAAAIMYTLVETCKRNKVDPYHYLADVLERLPTHPHKKINELLPYNWQPSQPVYTKNQNFTVANSLAL